MNTVGLLRNLGIWINLVVTVLSGRFCNLRIRVLLYKRFIQHSSYGNARLVTIRFSISQATEMAE